MTTTEIISELTAKFQNYTSVRNEPAKVMTAKIKTRVKMIRTIIKRNDFRRTNVAIMNRFIFQSRSAIDYVTQMKR